MDAVATKTKSRPGWAWLGFALAASGVALALASGSGYRLGWWPYRTGFQVLTAAAALGTLAATVSLGAALANWGLSRRATARATVGLVVGLAVAIIPLQWKLAAERLPRIHDITTDPEDPPRFAAVAKLRGQGDHPLDYAGAALAIKQRAAYPDIRPMYTRHDARRAFEAARAVLHDMGLRVVGESVPQGHIEAVDRTLLFGFQDDVVIRVRAGPAGTRVDARSMSRLGISDLGKNAKRLRVFYTKLRARLGE